VIYARAENRKNDKEEILSPNDWEIGRRCVGKKFNQKWGRN
jgi:hypothetical protein